mgnify:CR=1 FL=1
MGAWQISEDAFACRSLAGLGHSLDPRPTCLGKDLAHQPRARNGGGDQGHRGQGAQTD